MSAAFDPRRVVLSPLGEEDLELVRGWRNGERVRSRMFSSGPIAPEEHRAWWTRTSSDPSYAQYVLRYAERPLGTISFSAREPASGSADCGYYVGPDDAPRGAGTLLMHAGLRAAFGDRGLRAVRCEIFEDNEPSLRLVRRFAFSEREHSRPGVRCFTLSASAFAAAEPRVRAMLFGETPHAIR